MSGHRKGKDWGHPLRVCPLHVPPHALLTSGHVTDLSSSRHLSPTLQKKNLDDTSSEAQRQATRKACEVRVDAATETVERHERWVDGKNGGRLRPGSITRGPRRATVAVRQALVEALKDPRGGSGKEFFVGLKTGSAEDRRTFANVVTKLIPVEVQGDLGSSLTVMVKTFAQPDPSGRPPTRAELDRIFAASRDIPTQGTCVIGETASNAPMPTPITVETDDVSDAEVIER